MEITENHAASSSQLHLQAVWHVAKLQVHGRGQVAIKSVVLWGNVTLHKDDEESEVHARSLSHPAMQTHLLKLLAHGCEHRHPAVLDLGLTTPASAQMLAKLFFLKTYQTYHPTASACKTRHQHQPSLLKTSRSLSLERPRGSQKPTGAWSPTRPSKPQYAFASCRKSASAKFKYTAVHSSNLISIFSCFPKLHESYLKSSKVDTQEIQEEKPMNDYENNSETNLRLQPVFGFSHSGKVL